MLRLALLLPVLLLAACGSQDGASTTAIVATTGHIHAAVLRITDGTAVPSIRLCGPGVDPHSYRASTNDVARMDGAMLIVRNGFHLEAKLDELLGNGGRFAAKTWAMAEAFPKEHRLDWSEDGKINPNAPFDPHIWNHLPGWAACVRGLIERLATAFPNHRAAFLENGTAYVAEIEAAHVWAREQLGALPESRRFLVSGHDAFSYFAKAYGLKTISVLGIGNDPEPDIASIRSVSSWICARKVPVIFLDSITNPKIAEALQEACQAKDWTVKIATQRLYSDDLDSRPPADTYLGAFRTNVQTVLEALRPGS